VPLAVTEHLILQNITEETGLVQTKIFNKIMKSHFPKKQGIFYSLKNLAF
jgi:predicted DNA-binding transcriptional regulator AlpA